MGRGRQVVLLNPVWSYMTAGGGGSEVGTHGQGVSMFFIRWRIGTQPSLQAPWETFPELGGLALCLLLPLCLAAEPHRVRGYKPRCLCGGGGGQQSKSRMRWAGPPGRQLIRREQQPATQSLLISTFSLFSSDLAREALSLENMAGILKDNVYRSDEDHLKAD